MISKTGHLSVSRAFLFALRSGRGCVAGMLFVAALCVHARAAPPDAEAQMPLPVARSATSATPTSGEAQARIGTATLALEPPALDSAASPTTYAALYVATPSDLLTGIARRHDTTVAALCRLNPGLTLERLIEGDAVRVPMRCDAPPRLDREIRRGPRGRRQIALTFDAGWVDSAELDRLLDALERQGLAASFFLTGIFMRGVPDGAERIARRGHPIYNHSNTHPDFTTLSDAAITTQLATLDVTVARATSACLSTRPYWRPPYGDRDDRVLRVAAEAGFQSIYWTVDSLDWPKKPPATVESVFHRVCERPFERYPDDPDPLDGAIVLFHVSAEPTPEALDRICARLRAKGYAFVDLPTLLSP